MGLSEQLTTLMRLEEVSSFTGVKMDEVVLVITEWEKIKERDKNIEAFEEKENKKEVEFDGLTKSPAAEELPPSPMPDVHRIGEDYIVAYSEWDAVTLVIKEEEKGYTEVKKRYKDTCTPLNAHEALFNSSYIGEKFLEVIKRTYPAGVLADWIEGQSFYRLPFDFVITHMDTKDPMFFAYIDKTNGHDRVFYRHYIGSKVEEYLSGKGE
ncbi:hypothetical protein BigBertha_181 [Bacillus phage BigBertha]|uniref:Uncharacterized protein n=1 Tax=Bacillus phage BigBertha TaxID=1406781 RepID=U5PS26_9CAUD|nr:hypothetical protein BigBertha_181 [Bacillus phage BigBertha]AGY46689.1 hypothetical protein BigBertha_181 [Bacillus phage BigBertha]